MSRPQLIAWLYFSWMFGLRNTESNWFYKFYRQNGSTAEPLHSRRWEGHRFVVCERGSWAKAQFIGVIVVFVAELDLKVFRQDDAAVFPVVPFCARRICSIASWICSAASSGWIENRGIADSLIYGYGGNAGRELASAERHSALSPDKILPIP